MLASKRRYLAAFRHPSLRPALAAAAVILALLGQRNIAGQEQAGRGAVLALVAAVLFVLSHRGCRAAARPARTEAPVANSPLLGGARAWRLFFMATSLTLALLAFDGFAGNSFAGGFWYWLGALFYFVLAAAHRPRPVRSRGSHLVWLALLAITLLGIAFRFYRLDAIPAEMTSDHAEKLLDVRDVLDGWRPIFFPRNTGREALQFYLTAAIIRLGGLAESHLALKIGTALFGAITIPFTYLLGRELSGRQAGLYAAFLLAVSHWHVAISRVGLRFPFTATFAAPALAFLFRALRDNRRNDWLAAGLFLGLGLHGYTAMRVVPGLFVLLVLLTAGSGGLQAWRERRLVEATRLSRSFWENAALATALALLAFLPLLRYLAEEPHLFWYRTATRAQEGLAPGAAWPTFWLNVKNALLMFNYRGDVVPANTIPESPQLGLVTGALFLLGLSYLLWRGFACRERRAAYVLASFFVLLLPSILSLGYPEENPSAVRAGGAIPIVMLIAALPLATLTAAWWPRARRGGRLLFGAALGSLLLVAAVESAGWYFDRYRTHELLSAWNATEMGAVARDFATQEGSLDQVYHVAFPHWVDTRNIGINAGDVTWNNAVLDLDELTAHARDPAARLYLVHPQHHEALRRLQLVYPDGRLEFYDSERPGKDFLIFRVSSRP
jgi:uncharacterized membrane protein